MPSPLPTAARAAALLLLALALGGPLAAQDLPTPSRPADQDAPPIPAASSSSQALTDSLARAIASRPVTVPFQRTVDDALALAKASGKPLLICVNMDGETASDSLASGSYRDPAFGKLAAGFVPVIASPDRHAPDRDGRGRRVLCPRFGRVTCSEHIATEPAVFDRWFAGTRVAPRHLAVSSDGEVLFDLYLLNDLTRIDRALEKHGVAGELPAVGGGPDAWLTSPDRDARLALEQAFLQAAEPVRARLVEQALDPARTVGHPELLFLGLRDRAPSVARAAARQVLAYVTLADTDLLLEAARVLWPEREAVTTAAAGLDALGADDVRAKRLATMLPAALEEPAGLAPATWEAALAEAELRPWAGADTELLYDEVGRLGDAVVAEPERADLRRDLALTLLDLADGYAAQGQEDVSYLWQEAQDAARQATERDPDDGLAWALLARADWLLGGTEVAADAAAAALPRLLDDAGSVRVVDTLDILVSARAEQVRLALAQDLPVVAAQVSEVVAASRLLLLHPLAADWQLAVALDVLGGWELDGLHAELALDGVARWPASPDLHDHLRWHLLRDGDAADVVPVYASLAALEPVRGRDSGTWFAAYAALAAGDLLRSERRHDDALAAYEAALAGFDAAVEGDRPFLGLALTGIGRVHLDAGDAAGAAAWLRRAIAEAPEALDVPASDGETPAATVRAVSRALRGAGQRDQAVALTEALSAAR